MTSVKKGPQPLSRKAMTGTLPNCFCPACDARFRGEGMEIPDHEYALEKAGCYVECPQCKTLFQEPMPGGAELASFSGGRVFGMLLRCLVFLEALHKVGLQAGSGATKQAADGRGAWVARTIVVQAVFFATILLAAEGFGQRAWWPSTAVIAAAAYGGIYLYGLATVTVFTANLRAIAEHQLESRESSEHGRAVLRNFRCGWISRLVFGAYGFAEHGTHHLEPGIPYYHLPTSTLELAREDASLLPTRGYVGELLVLAKNPVPEAGWHAPKGYPEVAEAIHPELASPLHANDTSIANTITQQPVSGYGIFPKQT